MTIFDIDKEIEELMENNIDEETGELNESVWEKLEQLQMEREKKIKNIALLIKNTKASIDAIKIVKKSIEAKLTSAENKLERLRSFLAFICNGEKMKFPEVNIYYNHSKSLKTAEDLDLATIPDEFIKVEKSLKVADIKKAILEEGKEFEGVEVVETESIVVR